MVTPSPFFCTTFLGSTSTVLLSSFRSSGVIVFFACSSAAFPLPSDGLGDVGVELGGGGESLMTLGAGKFCFLSIASINRWKRRNKDSARINVDSRSIVFDNSLTNIEKRLASS